MKFDWQMTGVIVMVAVATGYLVRAGWQTFSRRRAAACGGCSQCPAGDESAELIEIGRLTPAADSDGDAATGGSATPDGEPR